MAGFDKIIGQGIVIDHIVKALSTKTISHAYIINGEQGMGKKMLASIFSMAVQCESKDKNVPCMSCRSCKQAIGKNHPDIRWIYHEKTGSISVDEIRQQLVNDMGIKPYSSEKKIYIIDEGEKMTTAAQNTLLKTIEEPPSYGMIFILTENKEMLLSTIQSRCVCLNMKPVSDEKIKEYLINKEGIPDYQAGMAVRFASGNVGRALKIATSDHSAQMRDDLVRVIKSIHRATVSDINQIVKDFSVYRDDMDSVIELMQMWFRDVLLYKASEDMDVPVFAKEIESIRQQASKAEYDQLGMIFEETDKLKGRIRSNVNFDISLELLFLKIREVFVEK